MGLDVVELILAIEESFEISISDQEADDLTTVGDIHRLVSSKLRVRDSTTCLTGATFYRTRRALAESLGVARRDIRPATLLDVIIPRGTRSEHWNQVRDRMYLKLPSLRHRDSIQWSLFALGIAVTIAFGYDLGLSAAWLVFLTLLGFVTGAILLQVTSRFAIEFPSDTVTVGDLSKQVLTLNYARLSRQAGSGNQSDAWKSLRLLIHDQTSVPLDQITLDARIVEDLRLD